MKCTIGLIHDLYGNYEQALIFYQKAQAGCQKSGDKPGEGTTLNNISQIFKARGDYDTALKYLERSLKIRQEIGDKSGMIVTLHNIAMIAENKDYQKYVEYESRAFALSVETKDAMGLFHVGQQYGQILNAMGKKEEGLQILKISYETGKQAGFPDLEYLSKLIKQLEAS